MLQMVKYVCRTHFDAIELDSNPPFGKRFILYFQITSEKYGSPFPPLNKK